jgi:hypothetical protein
VSAEAVADLLGERRRLAHHRGADGGARRDLLDAALDGLGLQRLRDEPLERGAREHALGDALDRLVLRRRGHLRSHPLDDALLDERLCGLLGERPRECLVRRLAQPPLSLQRRRAAAALERPQCRAGEWHPRERPRRGECKPGRDRDQPDRDVARLGLLRAGTRCHPGTVPQARARRNATGHVSVVG